MRTHILSSILPAAALLLASSPAAAQYELTRWQLDASSWSCERPILGGTFSPVYCRSDEQPEFVVVEATHDDSDGHMEHCKIRTVLARLHESGDNLSATRGEGAGLGTSSSWSGGMSDGTRSFERSGLGDSISKTVGGLLGN
jgi:hypothetical protein